MGKHVKDGLESVQSDLVRRGIFGSELVKHLKGPVGRQKGLIGQPVKGVFRETFDFPEIPENQVIFLDHGFFFSSN